MRIRPYILAGGRSSRMGTDKAALSLGGQTLLARAVNMLRTITALKDASGEVTVTVVGERAALEGADRAIADRHAGCGPLGGIESALNDLECGRAADWAFFIPVDMPFLRSKLIDWLLGEWIAASQSGARICHVVVNGMPQPLVSLVHKAAHPFVLQALTAGHFKVTPVLRSAVDSLASRDPGGVAYVLHTTDVTLHNFASLAAGGIEAGEQEQLLRLWFSNINTQLEFLEAETILAASGLMG